MTEAEVLAVIATDPVVWHNWSPDAKGVCVMSIDLDFEIEFSATEESRRVEADGEPPHYITRTDITVYRVYPVFTDDDSDIAISAEGIRKIEDFIYRKIHEV